ncbi:MAG TPA: acylase [Verrucomicrobiae bacterium]|jgi:acyl-homoserine-lactone acylase|nr:acylase [Verrucomicrobiae bacterium]
MRKLKITALSLAGLLVCAVLFLIVADRLEQPSPPDPATLIAKARQYDVRIKRDNFGVPHVVGPRDADVAFGLGFAQSEDDFVTLQQVALATRGQLAATEGPKAAVADYLVHLLRVWETINAKYESDLPLDVRHVLEAYADGVNYYAALHPDKTLPGLLPLTGKDVAAGFVFKTPFFYGLDRVLLKLNSPESGNTTASLSLSNLGQNAFLITRDAVPVGSNGVAVAPSRSADGATRLLVNSHQPYTGPVSWYEAVLESGQGWHVAGGFFPGSPFLLHGHNEHLGWANTVNEPDLIDVYKLAINPANPNQYRMDGQWRDFEKSDAKLRVKIWGPLLWTAHREVLYAAQGPVLKTDHGVFAIRYAGINEIRQPLQYYRLNKAANLTEWRAAMALQAIPSLNYAYADDKANIGYVYNGLFPVRKEEDGLDWQGVLPGDRSDLIWHRYLPFDKIPQIWDPPGGLVFNSNNTPFRAATPADDLKPQDFSPTLGIQSNMTNRAWRALENYGADSRITAEKFRAYKFDLAYSDRSEVVQVVNEAIAIDPGNDTDVKQAQELLKRWDHQTNVANRSTALAILFGEPVLRRRTEIKGKPQSPSQAQIMAALREAIKTLKTHFGRLDPEWGQVNRLRRGKLDLPIDGGPDVYRAVYGVKQPDGTLTAAGGDTFIMFVTWDKDGKLSSDSIHQFGSATLDQNSPHYADQSPLFVAMKTKPVLFTQAQLAGHIEADYRPGEREASKH